MKPINGLLCVFYIYALCGAVFSLEDEEPTEETPKPNVYSLHITSKIRYRYAQTVITSRVANPANVSQQTTFHVVLPETAFITGFVMIINEKEYKAYVKEKEEAKTEYNQAVLSGQAAAHIAYSARDSNQFTVSVNLEPSSKITFNLTYEELLERVLSNYKHEININPGQIVNDMKVEVDIEESQPIINLKVPDLKMTNEIREIEKENPLAKITTPKPEKAIIQWAPTADEQRELKEEGIKGQFIVHYDVDRTTSPQEILVNEGYFVHFFANDDLPPLNKHVVFVLDLSGSMHGRKLEQVKEAMNKILSDLNQDNYFSLVLFSDTAKAWAPNKTVIFPSYSFQPVPVNSDGELTNEYIVPASPENVNAAKQYISSLDDLGGTNIIAGLRMGIKLTKIGKEFLINTKEQPEPILIFLTDGEPNVEMSDPKEITETVTNLNSLRSAIFSLGFGDGADMKFLRNISLANSGYARNIYEGADASLQLKNFFSEVASPLLANVTFQYLPGQVENDTTKVHFDTLFSGSELVVAGKLATNSLTGALRAKSPSGIEEIPFTEIKYIIIDHIPESPIPGNRTYGHLERMWAYKSISQLLDKNVVEQKDSIKEEALKLALKYSFVTPLTSLVVVKPNETTAVDTEKSSLTPPRGYTHLASRRFSLLLKPELPQSSVASSRSLMRSSPTSFANLFGAYGPYGQSQHSAPLSNALGMGGGFAGFLHGMSTTANALNMVYQSSGRPAPVATWEAASISSPGRPAPVTNWELASMSFPDSMDKTMDPLMNYSDSLFLMNYTDVTWLSNQTDSGNQYLTPPSGLTLTPFLIDLNASSKGMYECSVNSTEGQCTHFVHCVLNVFIGESKNYIPYKCEIQPNFLGVCCPNYLKQQSLTVV